MNIFFNLTSRKHNKDNLRFKKAEFKIPIQKHFQLEKKEKEKYQGTSF